MAYIELKNVKKIYEIGDNKIAAAAGVDIEIEEGEFVVIVGPSGAGKSTVMNIIGGMDTATSGQVKIAGKDISLYTDRQLTNYRREDVGFIFQSYNLIPNLTALENVELATQICEDTRDTVETLSSVGLSDRMNNFPAQMSGGEQQRVAIARALAKNPKLLLCDEPTGALDTDTGIQILKVLREASDDFGMTVLVITHNPLITQMADRVIEIRDGLVERNEINQIIKSVDDIEW